MSSAVKMPEQHVEVFRDLTIGFTGRTLLSNQELSVPYGSITVLMGPSGVGKSVLADTVFKLDGARAETTVEGQIGSARDEGALVFQEGGGLPHLTVRDNLMLVSSENERCQEIAEKFQIMPGGMGSNLSGGERRRLAVGRSLLANKKFLWLDEPEAGLDLQRTQELSSLLRKQVEEHDLAAVVTTHNTEFAAQLADRVVFLGYDGRLQEIDVAAEEFGTKHEAIVRQLNEKLSATTPSGGLTADVDRRKAGLSVRLRQVTRNLNAGAWLLQIAEALPYLWSFLRNRQSNVTFLQSLVLSAGRGLFYYPFIGAIFGGVFILIFLNVPFLPPATVIEEFGSTIVLRFSPPIAAILVAACAGSTIASWVGQMSSSRQLDALAVLDIRVTRVVLGPVWWGLTIATLVNTVIFALALSCVFAAFLWSQDGYGQQSMTQFFLSFVGSPRFYGLDHLAGALLRAIGYGMLVSAVTVGCASAKLRSPAEVAAAVTRGIVWSSIVVMLVELLTMLADQGARQL